MHNVKQEASVVEKLATEILTVNELFVLSVFRLPPRQGGILLGFYAKRDNMRYLEVTVMGKINRVLVRYLREDGKTQSVNLQNANLSDGNPHSIILRVSGLQRDMITMELYVDCRQVDSSVGLPAMVKVPPEQADTIDVRTGHRAYARMQGSLEELKLFLGGTVVRVGALQECPFQKDDALRNMGMI
ncbi:thrombospondin-3a-like [Chiloscyllium plagiosum]|uniref:thrombospondin-3a-like n=1 Tax=Chiloscyllium plagiosum TaxID=36176 RepID=UPI001CB7E8BE|nr:thrombospondin-3a-like [Chiloscyllium plagiosum]